MSHSNHSHSIKKSKKLLFVVNVDWSFLSHRLPIALAAQKCGYDVHLAAKTTQAVAQLRHYNLTVHALPLTRSRSTIKQLLHEFLAILSIFQKTKPDLVHLVTIKPVLLGGIAARITKIPSVVVAISGLGFMFIRSGFWAAVKRFFVAFLYQRALKHRNISVIFQNNDDLKMLQKTVKIPLHQATFIRGCGVDLKQYHPPQKEPNTPLVIVLAARLIADKGVREFVEAARLLKPTLDARFVLVGDIDPDNPSSLTQQEIQTWMNEGLIECWGHCQDMATVFSCCHVVTLPSYREGFPKVLMEAAACGRPIITTDVPGCRDAIIPKRTGLLIPHQDASALAQAITTLAQDTQLCIQMGIEARSFAEKHFSVDLVIQNHLDLYAQRLAECARAL